MAQVLCGEEGPFTVNGGKTADAGDEGASKATVVLPGRREIHTAARGEGTDRGEAAANAWKIKNGGTQIEGEGKPLECRDGGRNL